MKRKLKIGDNVVDGVKVTVVRRRGRRINLRVLPDGTVRLMVPHWWATLAQGAEFLAANWGWALGQGATMLQTDYAAEMIVYLTRIGRRSL